MTPDERERECQGKAGHMRHRAEYGITGRTKKQVLELARHLETTKSDVVRRAVEAYHRQYAREMRAAKANGQDGARS